LFALGRAADAKYAYQKGISLAPLDQQLRAGLAQVMEQEQGKLGVFPLTINRKFFERATRKARTTKKGGGRKVRCPNFNTELEG
jgi:hypothetical protein